MGMLLRRHYESPQIVEDPDFKKAEESFKAAKRAETVTAEKVERAEKPETGRGRKRKDQ